MIFHIVFKWRLKLCIAILEDYGINLVQTKDNNSYRIDEMAYMLWDIMESCEIKYIWQMANETWFDEYGLVSVVACFAWTRRDR